MKKPKVLIDWEAAGPPMVCYNCEFNTGSECAKFNAIPPEDFQQTPGACDQWDQQIPF
jgi:hypothetical protein